MALRCRVEPTDGETSGDPVDADPLAVAGGRADQPVGHHACRQLADWPHQCASELAAWVELDVERRRLVASLQVEHLVAVADGVDRHVGM